MCSLDGRSGINTVAIPKESGKRAWKDQLEGWIARWVKQEFL